MSIYSRQHARSSLFHTARFRAVSLGATLLGYVVLVRGMSEHAFGIYNLFYAFIPVVTTLFSFGLEPTLRRFQPEYLRSGRTYASEWLMRRVVALRFATTVAAIAVVLLAWNLIAPRLGMQGHRLDFAIFGVLMILFLQSTVLQLALASHMLHRYSVGSAAAISVGKLLAYAAIYVTTAFTLRAAITADIAAYALGCLWLWVVHRRTAAPAGAQAAPEPGERRRLVRYAVFNHFNDASSLLVYGQADNFFIGAMLTPVAVAAYAFYGKLVEMIGNLVPQRLFDNVIQPLFFAVPGSEADSRLSRYFTFLVDCNLALLLPAISFAIVYDHDLVRVFFAGKYDAYAPLLPLVLALSVVPLGLSVPISLVAQYHERPGLMLASELFGVYQVLAMIVLVPSLGLYGAALSTGSFHALRNGWVWWRLRRQVRWRNLRGVLTSGLLVWAVVAALCAAMRMEFVSWPATVHLAIGVVASGLGLIAYLRTRAISPSDREVLSALMHGREAHVLRWLGLAAPAGVGTGG